MKNVGVLTDLDGTIINSQQLSETLTDLERFVPQIEETKKLVQEILMSGMFENLEIVKDIAYDFYGAWLASSTELIETISFEKVLEMFQILHPISELTWEDASLQFLEDNPDQVQVFRGESKSIHESGRGGLSWSLSRDCAENYKNRYQDGQLVTGIVHTKDIYAYFMEEFEVVLVRSYIEDLIIVE